MTENSNGTTTTITVSPASGAKKKSSSTKKKRDRATHPPKRKVYVRVAKASGNVLEVEMSPLRKEGRSAGSYKIECLDDTLASRLAEHAPRIHARKKVSGLLYTLRRYSQDPDLLTAARERAAKMKIRREEERKERERIRKAKEAEQEKQRRLARMAS